MMVLGAMECPETGRRRDLTLSLGTIPNFQPLNPARADAAGHNSSFAEIPELQDRQPRLGSEAKPSFSTVLNVNRCLWCFEKPGFNPIVCAQCSTRVRCCRKASAGVDAPAIWSDEYADLKARRANARRETKITYC